MLPSSVHRLDRLQPMVTSNTYLPETPACLGSELGAVLPAAEKLEQVDSQLVHSGRIGRYSMPFGDKKAGTGDDKLVKVCRDSSKVAVEQVKGITSQVGRGQPCWNSGGSAGLKCWSAQDMQCIALGWKATLLALSEWFGIATCM